MFAIIGVQESRIIQPMSLMAKQSITEGSIDSEIWGSPGSRQLLQLQHFLKFLKIWDPPFNFVLLNLVGIALFYCNFGFLRMIVQ